MSEAHKLSNYHYNDILKSEYLSRTSRNSSYSLRAFANDLDINSGALSQIMSGKRIVSYKVAIRLCDNLNLKGLKRKQFLYSLAKAYESKNLTRKSPEFKTILKDKASTLLESKEIDFNQFKLMSSWYYTAILEMTFMHNFHSEPKWIANKLGINVIEVKEAIEYLLKIGLLQRSNSGKLSKTSKQLVTSNRDKTSEAHKNRQKEIIKKSIVAMDNQSINKRHNTSMTMSINPKKIELAKEEIRIFMNKMCDLLETDERTDIYELNINLFSLLDQKK